MTKQKRSRRVPPTRSGQTKPKLVLSADDRSYHEKLVARARAAHATQQRIAAAQADVDATFAALRSWQEHLTERYGLAEGDEVDEEGKILRKS